MTNLSATLKSYGLATGAMALISAGHFLLQVVVLRHLGSAEFGLIAFVMTLMQFATGICNALLAAPIAVSVAASGDKTDLLAAFYGISTISALIISVGVSVIVALVGDQGWQVSVIFAAAAGLYSVRWFGRGEAYTRQRQLAAALSDVVYALGLLGGLLVATWLFQLTLLGTATIFLVAAAASLLPFGAGFILRHLALSGLPRALRRYAAVWREHARWALIGLVTTEATANSHAYLVTAIAGPAAFAPLAAAMLFLRPIGIFMVSLTQLERPAVARALSAGQIAQALMVVRRFTAVLLLVAVGTMVLAAGIMQLFPSLIFKPGLSQTDVIIATAIWSAVMLVLCLQGPRSLLLQSAGLFHGLAQASIRSCGVTIIIVLGLLYVTEPVYSALGVLVGQIVMTVEIILRCRVVSARSTEALGAVAVR